ncbi:MAG TPA: LamB/YcsF family protein, partial [Herpetosiphonaceae bacterium]
AVAALVAEAVRGCDPRLVLVGLAQSQLTAAGAAAGLRVAHEGFIDRAYEPDGSLRNRKLPGAVHDDEGRALAQAVSLARDGSVVAADGSVIALRVDTLCLHGDTPRAAEFARLARQVLEPLVGVRSLASSLAP